MRIAKETKSYATKKLNMKENIQANSLLAHKRGPSTKENNVLKILYKEKADTNNQHFKITE